MWKTLRHPNVLPLLGVVMTENRLIMVSEWMVKGNINELVTVDSNADRLGPVCFSFNVFASFVTDDHLSSVMSPRG